MTNNGTNGLVGTAFPTTGILEMPKPNSAAQLPRPNPAAQFQNFTPEQKKLIQHTRQKQQQQQQQLGHYNLGGLNVGDSGHFAAAPAFQEQFQTNGMQLDVFGTSQSGSAAVSGSTMPVMGSQSVSLGGGLHRATPSDNSITQAGSVSREMLHSFMQRNADGSGGMGMT